MSGENGNQGDPNATSQSPLEQRMKSMLDLSTKFGGSGKIPEEDLSAIGYVRRVQEDGTIRLMPFERVAELAQKDPDWEKPLKDKERPFDQISVDVPTAERQFRFIPRGQRKLLEQRLTAVEYSFYPNWADRVAEWNRGSKADEPRHQNLRAFTNDFLDFYKDMKDLDISFDALVDGLRHPLAQREESGEKDNQNGEDWSFGVNTTLKKYSELDRSVTSKNSQRLFDELTQQEGFFADVQEIRNRFREYLGDRISAKTSVDDATFQSMGIVSHADFIRSLFPRYLAAKGLTEMAAVIKTAPHLDQISESLSYLDQADPTIIQEKELRRMLKVSSHEEKIEINTRLKEIENAKRMRRQIRQGLIDYFSIPQVYADDCRAKVKIAKDFLTASKTDREGSAQYTFDATPNEALDADPGQVSGDCTRGKPLPFDRVDTPLYNVKVFDTEGQHAGNMYLLVTNTKAIDGKVRKVWHFDAMQVPKGGIYWDKGIGTIVSSIAQLAEVKGIDAITANDKLHLISNYDFIAKAVNDYWDTHGRQRIDVVIPQMSDRDHSSLQGKGSAIVLWSKEKLSEEYEGDLEVDEGMFNIQNEQMDEL